jgi:hypothetical protein
MAEAGEGVERSMTDRKPKPIAYRCRKCGETPHRARGRALRCECGNVEIIDLSCGPMVTWDEDDSVERIYAEAAE